MNIENSTCQCIEEEYTQADFEMDFCENYIEQ